MKMKISSADQLSAHELIGLNAIVTKSKCNSISNLSGKVIDETQKMLTLLSSDEKERKVSKGSCDFQFKLSNGTVVDVKGHRLIGRPEDRIKKVFRRRW